MTDLLEVGSDFSGVGAFDQALKRLKINYKTIFSCDMDKYVRQSYIANYGEPDYYPLNVYDREIPKKSLGIYMTSPPCQSFSLAGKRKGETDKRGILFYNSHEFIAKNNPRYFIFENVKGLLSDNDGKTFQNWVNLLGGKSVNGNPVIFPLPDATPYHIYHRVLNAKHYGVPQNRERVFIIGIRDDSDNSFSWPKKQHLTKRLKDVSEDNVDEKYYLSDKMIENISSWKSFKNPLIHNLYDENSLKIMTCLTSRGAGETHSGMKLIKIKSATKKGFEIANEGDSINFERLESKTRRGKVGKQIAQTLDTSCNQAVIIGAIRGRNEDNPKSRKSGLSTVQMLEINENGTSNALTTLQKDNVVIQLNTSKESGGNQPYKQNRIYSSDGISPVLDTECVRPSITDGYRIRRLTPRECFRLMDFPDDFKFVVSDTQLYRQAGNSIVVAVLAGIIEKLKLT